MHGYDQGVLFVMEQEALALIQPSYLPGTELFEEAIYWFAHRARLQMASEEPALVTYQMAVS